MGQVSYLVLVHTSTGLVLRLNLQKSLFWGFFGDLLRVLLARDVRSLCGLRLARSVNIYCGSLIDMGDYCRWGADIDKY